MAVVDWNSKAVAQTAWLYPYVPGKPIKMLLAEKGLKEAVKLASNENPYGPSPKAIKTVKKAVADVHRYPDGDCSELKQALAVKHACGVENILLGNGSSEALRMVIQTFASAGDEVLFSRRAFIMYPLYARMVGATGVAVPESDGLSHDLDAMANAVTKRTKVICIANPNNPTGTLHGTDAMQNFLDRLPRDVIIIMDEAYYEFVADELGDSISKLNHPGLVISRTFSKAYGLAGLRIGYAIADKEIISLVNRFREPFNVNLLAQSAALAALDDQDWVMARVADCRQERDRLELIFDAWGVLGGRSFGNFVLLRHAHASRILQLLEDQGIIPRPLGPYGMPDYLRISVGTEQENEQLLKALESILSSAPGVVSLSRANECPVDHLVVIGVGLIGGSAARALKHAGFVGRVTGVGRSRENLDRARELGIIDHWTHNISEAVHDADMVLVAVPMGAYDRVFAELAESLPEHAIVTDAGSTKQHAIDVAHKHLSNPSRFVPAHPIAGTEQSGAEASFVELFEDRLCILTPEIDANDDVGEQAVVMVESMWESMGSHVIRMGAGSHDDLLASVSHLPHLAAFALVNAVRKQGEAGDGEYDPFRFAAGGFRDFTRIASSSPEMWRDIIISNSAAIADKIDALQTELAEIKSLLASRDGEKL
ncbi:MAG: histidinol-phosphate transaminase [Mariprofundaceae bacterium]